MTHDSVVQLVGTWGQLYIIAIFLAAAVYALWPRNRDKFARAARLALDDDQRAADAPRERQP